MTTPTQLQSPIERAVAVDAFVDPRTVRRAIAGGAVRPMTLERIANALRARHLEHFLPKAG